MSSTPPDTLLSALNAALRACASPWANVPLERLKDKGLAHDHVRLVGTGVLARIPKQSQLALSAQANLNYQTACFVRVSAAGHSPRLRGVLPLSTHLPHGALLVEEIQGRNAVLPNDLTAIVQSLAAMHALALPPEPQRAPLLNIDDPLHALLDEITDHARHLSAAQLHPAVTAQIHNGLAQLRATCSALPRPQRHLIAFDGHPGNFIVRADGVAILVDLEKCRYSYPGLDLAHATLYTSTTWDIDSHAVLTLPEVIAAYAAWARAMGPQAAAVAQSWHVPLRHAMWLWSITWCAKWRAISGAAAKTSPDGEDWSTERSDQALVAHVRERVDHYLSPVVVRGVAEELDALKSSHLGRHPDPA